MNIYKTKKYLEDAMFSSLNGGAANEVNKMLNSINGNYSNDDLLDSVIGVGTRWDGKLEIALDDECVCHLHGCQNLQSKISNTFYLGGHQMHIYRRSRAGIHLQSGTAVGHQALAATGNYGTAGGLLLSKKEGFNARLFSNNHVLANSNRGKIGDLVYQYRNRYPEIIGRLERFVTIYPGIFNTLDLAVASLDTDIDLYASRYITPRRARLGERVVKTGATTGTRSGFVASIDYTDKVKYPGFQAVFNNQTQIRGLNGLPFSDGGDSGSLIFSKEDEAFVGLLFAGGAHGTIANPADIVYTKLRDWKYVK
jgi:hypothetical protein